MNLAILFMVWSILCLRTTVGYTCNSNGDCYSRVPSTSSVYCCRSNLCYFSIASCQVTTSCSIDDTCYYPRITGSYCCKSGRCSYSSSYCSGCSVDSDCKTSWSSTYCCRSGSCSYSSSSCAVSTCSSHQSCQSTDSTSVFCCITGDCYYSRSTCSVPSSCSADYDCKLSGYTSYCCRYKSCYYNTASCQASYCSAASTCYYPGVSGTYCCNNGVCGYGSACYSSIANIDLVDEDIVNTARTNLIVSAISTIVMVILARKSCTVLAPILQAHGESATYPPESPPPYSPKTNRMYPQQPMGVLVAAQPTFISAGNNIQLVPGLGSSYNSGRQMVIVGAGPQMIYQAPVPGQFMYQQAQSSIQMVQPGQLFIQSQPQAPAVGQIIASPAMQQQQQQYQAQPMPPTAPAQMSGPAPDVAPAQLPLSSDRPSPAAPAPAPVPAPAPAQTQAQPPTPSPAEEHKEK